MAAQQKVDYERIEPGWRAGILSPAQLAEDYTKHTGITVSRVAIIKHFEKLGVPRDLKAKIQAKADAIVAQAMVTGKVTTATTVTTAAIIGSQATTQANIRIGHQAAAASMQKIVAKLARELERQTEKKTALKDRASTVKSLVESFGRLVAVEREAHGINSAPIELNDPFTAMLTSLQGTARTIVPVPDIQDVEAK